MSELESQTLLGRRVRVSTGADGVYIGDLLEMAGTPWRGRVRITGVKSPALHLENGALCRRGHRPGEFLDVAHGVVSTATDTGYPTYSAAVQAALNEQVGSHSGYQTAAAAWFNEAMAGSLRAVLVAEAKRLQTGRWHLASIDMGQTA